MTEKSNVKPGIRRVCWAEGTQDCEGELTKEHVISKNILDVFGAVSGNRDGQKIQLGSGSFVIRNLCEKHNKLLSRFDAAAGHFFNSIKRSVDKGNPKKFSKHRDKILRTEIDGWALERWYAKTFMNLLVFRYAAALEKTPPYNPHANNINEALFNNGDIDDPFGLYFIKPGMSVVENAKWNSAYQFIEAYQDITFQDNITNELVELKLPTCFYTRFGPSEVIGYFNISGLSNKEFIKATTPLLNKMKSHGQKNLKGMQLQALSGDHKDITFQFDFTWDKSQTFEEYENQNIHE